MLDTVALRASSGVPEFSATVADPTFWLVAGLSFFFLRDLIDGGFGLSWGRWAQAAVLLLAVAAIEFDLYWHGSVWNPAFGVLVSGVIVVVFGYLGLNFILEGIFATPGCEARALQQLIGRISGREMAEYRCSVLGPLDEWEAASFGGEEPERE